MSRAKLLPAKATSTGVSGAIVDGVSEVAAGAPGVVTVKQRVQASTGVVLVPAVTATS